MHDYLIVGLGLAGIALCETLEEHGKRFLVISDHSQASSVVAAGLYNPVVLKRFNLAWNADGQLKTALPFYSKLEKKLKTPLDYKIPLLRRFASIEEQNLWFEAADKPALSPFMSLQLLENSNPNIEAPFGYGQVLHTGRVDTNMLVKAYAAYLAKSKRIMDTTFDFNELVANNEFIEYKGLKAKQIVFASGFGLKKNPYFNYLPLQGTKGELLTIHAPELKENHIIKASVFCIPLGEDRYRVGATYKWKDKTNVPTEEARLELQEKLEVFLKCRYELREHVAAVRPTVADRRPLVGKQPEYKNIYVLNGLGSRGVLIAPYASIQLFNHIEHQKPLNKDLDIARYAAKYKGL